MSGEGGYLKMDSKKIKDVLRHHSELTQQIHKQVLEIREKLDEVQAIQKQDPNTPLRLEPINDGVFFKADEFPQLARIGLPRPQGYQALNNILQPI